MYSSPPVQRSPFSLLTQLAGDDEQLQIFSERSTVEAWLAAERALAQAQADAGEIDGPTADAIVAAAVYDIIDCDQLWTTARTVGYPILGLVRQIAAALPPGPDGHVHFGATTQDIMDTGLAQQLAQSLGALDQRLRALGDAVAAHVAEHAATVMPARTHAQQAVPTTFGATLAVLLAQLTTHRERLRQAAPRIARISLFGAGGTAAALGPHSASIRTHVAHQLGLYDTEVPWHVDRDGIAEFGWLCATITATCARLARNIIDLSRTEIAEVFEPFSSHRGASSTMPQKINPISSEIVIGLSGTAGALASSLLRAQEAGHERAAGEWQIEWQTIPQLAVLAGSALAETLTVVEGLRIDAEKMRANLTSDHGLIMAEAHMITLASTVGRERAHDLTYEAAGRARSSGRDLADALHQVLIEHHLTGSAGSAPLGPDDYLGEATTIAAAAIQQWSAVPDLNLPASPVNSLGATQT